MNSSQNNFDWIEHYPLAVTVCDTQAVILAMNGKAIEHFAKRGGAGLIGTSLFDCHPESANRIIRQLLDTQQANVYIVESRSGRRLIQQTPWYRDGRFAGIVETTAPLDGEIPVKKR